MAQADQHSDGDTEPASGVDDLLERLRARVAERRAAGQYPEGLEEDLDSHFRRIVHHRSTARPVEDLDGAVRAVESHASFTGARIPLESRVPGGKLVHRSINKAVSRQTQGVLEQVQGFADSVLVALTTLAKAVQDPTSHTHGDLIAHIESIVERLDAYERAPTSEVLAAGSLTRRVEQLEKAESRRGFNPWFKYEDFEREVGRSREALLSEYRATAELFDGAAPVVDIGCGRGELIELLHERGTDAWGIELDPVQAAEARDRGLQVEVGDGLEILAGTPDGSLGGIALIQVIEHLTAQQLVDLARFAYDKVRPGGRVVIETPNPLSLYVHAYAFFLDPTHDHLVHPIYARFLFQQAGFSEVAVQWLAPPPESDVLETPGGSSPEVDRNVERLNRLLFAAQNYMLVITR